MLTIVTGLTEEADVARECAPNALILCGQAQRDNMHNLVPANCTAIMKFGLCGGLSPELATIGQFVLADMLNDGAGNRYVPDPDWLHRMFVATKAYERRWFSNGLYRDADTPTQRDILFKATGCAAIDDEGLAVAEFAKLNGLPFVICGSLSDTYLDTVPRAAFKATNPDGTSSVSNVLAWLEANPAEDPAEIVDLIKIAGFFQTSLAELRTAGRMLGQTFQAQ
jgi:hypothetical protein